MLSVDIDPKDHFYKMYSHESYSKIGMGIKVFSSSLVESTHFIMYSLSKDLLSHCYVSETAQKGQMGEKRVRKRHVWLIHHLINGAFCTGGLQEIANN